MTLSREEAAQALADIAASQTRSATLAAYRRFAPYLLLWGVVWLLGYGMMAWDPGSHPLLWPLLNIGGIAGSFVLSRHTTRLADQAWRRHSRRAAGLLVVLFVYSQGVFALFDGPSVRQVCAFFPLLVALSYCILGLWTGARMLLAGVLLAIATLVGFFLLGPWFYAWMAVVGGGTLIGTALWLERI